MLQTIAIGNVGAEPKFNNKDGKEFITFRIAHNDSWTDQAGNQHTQLHQASEHKHDNGIDVAPSGSQRTIVHGSIQQPFIATINLNFIQIVEGAIIDDRLQLGCARKGIVADMLEGAGEGDLLQSNASFKCVAADGGYTLGDRDAGQMLIAAKCAIADDFAICGDHQVRDQFAVEI